MQHPLQGPPQQRIVKMTLRWRTQTQLRQFFLFVIVVAVLSCLFSLSLSLFPYVCVLGLYVCLLAGAGTKYRFSPFLRPLTLSLARLSIAISLALGILDGLTSETIFKVNGGGTLVPSRPLVVPPMVSLPSLPHYTLPGEFSLFVDVV